MSRLPFNEEEQALLDESSALNKKALELQDKAFNLNRNRDKARPLIDRLRFAATARCSCGHGMAYDPTGEVRLDKDSPFVMPAQWDCSALLLGIETDKDHSYSLPFSMYEVKSEDQPSAYGATTR